MYAAQATPQFDAEILKKGHFWMDTSYETSSVKSIIKYYEELADVEQLSKAEEDW